MAESTNSGGATLIALLVGGLIVAVAVVAWFVYGGGRPAAPQIPNRVSIEVAPPKLPEAPRLPDAPIPRPQ